MQFKFIFQVFIGKKMFKNLMCIQILSGILFQNIYHKIKHFRLSYLLLTSKKKM